MSVKLSIVQNIKLLENCEYNYLTIVQHSLMQEMQ